jgi:mitochondrial fission protein ELM1
VIALAEALGRPFETRQLTFNGWRRLGPRLLGASLLSLTGTSRRMILSEPPPDLTISAGHRSVAVVQALRRRSKGRTRSIHVGFPRISPAHFDLVITTPQYPVADNPNLLRIPYALTQMARRPAAGNEDLLDPLVRPRRLLIVGGPTLFWRLEREELLNRLRAMLDDARSDGGSVMVTTSPRTPRLLHQDIAETLDKSSVSSVLASPGKPPRLSSLLAAADTIAVTADSVAMVSDAIWTGKPIALIPVRKSPLGKVAFAVGDAFQRGRRIHPQDLRFFWRALSDIGISECLARPRTSTNEVMNMILDRVRPILEGLE